MLLQYYVIRVLCCYVTMLLQCYVIRALCCYVIMLSEYYTIAISQQSSFHIHADYQYITTFIKQRIQLYYNNLHIYDTESVNQDTIVQYSIKLSILNI